MSFSLTMIGDSNLQDCVKRAQNGEAEAFGHLYDHYHAQIYRFVFLRVSSKQVAEDLAHEVFASAWKQIGSYEERGYPFSSWLYRIARNKVVDHYRTKREETDIEAVDPGHFAEEAGLEEKFDDALQLAEVQSALVELSDDYQEVIILRFIEELSVRETAKALDKSESSVKVTQHRALKKLKAFLNDQ